MSGIFLAIAALCALVVLAAVLGKRLDDKVADMRAVNRRLGI